MRLVRRRAILISVLAVFVLLVLGLSVLFAGGPTPQYDANSSGMIERDEAHNALKAYFDGDLTQEQALDVLFHYWAAQPVDQPPPVVSSQPTPTPVPTSTPLTLSIQAPTITFTRVNSENMQVNWRHNASDVTGAEIQHRSEGGAWTPWRKAGRNSSGVSSQHSLSLSLGDRVEVRVRSLTRNGPSSWTNETIALPSPHPTHTPVPTPTPTPFPAYLTMADDITCEGKEVLKGYIPEEKRFRHISPVSDVMLMAEFYNSWSGIPGHPTPTPQGYRPWHTPTPHRFSYGFVVREVSEGRDSVGLVVRATQKGQWSLELKGCHGEPDPYNPYACVRRRIGGERVLPPVSSAHTFRVIDSGHFSDDGVEFSVDEAGSNHMAFIAKGEDYRFFVNGVEIPLEIDAEDRVAIEKYASPFRYVSDGKWYGKYRPFGSAKIAISERDTTGRIVYLSTYPPWGACVPGE